MEAAHPTVRPDEFDVVINDIRNEDVANIGAMLEVQDLSDATGPGAFPTRGIMYGSGLRIFVPLVVKTKELAVNISFLMDTGSPSIYLREETLEALGYKENIPAV